MPIFKVKNKKLILVKEKAVGLEKDLQELTENNLDEIFGLEFVASEFKVQNFYIDTLVFDSESKSFVIIEYKREKSFSVVDQGLAYLSLMLNNKADFILEYNEKKGKDLKKRTVDWSQSKVIFIAPSFTPYQSTALGFKDLPIELWEVKTYENQLILFSQLRPTETKESIKSITKGKTAVTVTKRIKTYEISDLIKPGWKKTKSLFDILDDAVLNLHFPKARRRILKFYIAYSNEGEKSFLEIIPQASGLKLYIREKINEIPKNSGFLFKDCSKIGRLSNGNSYFMARTDHDVIAFVRFLKKLKDEKNPRQD